MRTLVNVGPIIGITSATSPARWFGCARPPPPPRRGHRAKRATPRRASVDYAQIQGIEALGRSRVMRPTPLGVRSMWTKSPPARGHGDVFRWSTGAGSAHPGIAARTVKEGTSPAPSHASTIKSTSSKASIETRWLEHKARYHGQHGTRHRQLPHRPAPPATPRRAHGLGSGQASGGVIAADTAAPTSTAEIASTPCLSRAGCAAPDSRLKALPSGRPAPPRCPASRPRPAGAQPRDGQARHHDGPGPSAPAAARRTARQRRQQRPGRQRDQHIGSTLVSASAIMKAVTRPPSTPPPRTERGRW